MDTCKLFATPPAADLGSSIAEKLGMAPGKLHTARFADGEAFARFDESVRGYAIILVARVNMPYEHLFELCLAVDAARRASATEIILVLPYLPHSRQERKDNHRAPVAARLMADFLQEAGANRIITLDMHTTAIEGFYKIPVDHLDTMNLFVPHIAKHYSNEQLTLCSPDFGGLKRVKQYRKKLGCEMVVIDKERSGPNEVGSMEILGEVEGRNVVIIDDMVDTAGTLCRAADRLKQAGAASVSAYCTHGLLSGEALKKVNESALERLYICDTVQKVAAGGKIEYISCDALLANALDRLMKNRSLKAMNDLA